MNPILRHLALLLLLGLASARAGVTINFDAGIFYSADNQPVPENQLVVLLVSDTTGDGFGLARPGSLASGGFIDGADDLILGRAYVFSEDGNVFGQGAVNNLSLTGNWGTGDRLGVYWFTGLDGSATTLSAGTSYGYYSVLSGEEGDDSDPWLTPTDGFTVGVQFLNGAYGPHDASLFRSTLTVVPEPAAYAALAGLLALGLALRRQRRA